jgi:hypothetical protein
MQRGKRSIPFESVTAFWSSGTKEVLPKREKGYNLLELMLGYCQGKSLTTPDHLC